MCTLLRVGGGGQNFVAAKLYFECWMSVMEQLCAVVACSVRVIGSLRESAVRLCCRGRGVAVIVVLVICIDGAPTESRLCGFHGHRKPISFVRRVVILRFRWVAGSVGRFFQSFLPFDGPCCSWSHYLVSWGVPSGGERDSSHLRKASLCPHTVVAYHCG